MALTSRLQKNQLAFVLHDPPLPNRVRRTPSTSNGAIVGSIPPGVVMLMLEGPVEANGLLWWKVRSNLQRVEGWTPERDGSSFFVAPVEERALCTHAVRTRLHKGDGALVTTSRAINVREAPSLEGAITDAFAPGAELNVVGGPLCANNIVWWNISAAQLTQPRWVAEAQEGQGFLTPTSVNKNGAPAGQVHLVARGETWAIIAQRFGKTSTLLQNMNLGLKRPGLLLQAGDRMWIPV